MTTWLIQHLTLSVLSVGVAIVLALGLFACVRGPVLRHRVLAAFLPVLLLMVPVQVLVSEGRTPRAPAERDAAPIAILFSTERIERPQAVTDGPPDARPGSAHPQDPASSSQTSGPVPAAAHDDAPRKIPWLDAALAAYLAGVGVLLVLYSFRVGRTVAFLRSCRPVTDPAVLGAWQETAQGHPRLKSVRVLESDAVDSPGCWGPWRRAVVLPAADPRLADPQRLALVLRHELIHLLRRDGLAAMLQRLWCAAMWFHPLVWVYGRVLDRYRELSCDALVIQATGQHRTYAMTLLDYCRPDGARRGIGGAGSLSAFGFDGNIRRRLTMIDRLQSENGRPRRRLPRVVIGAGLVAALCCSAGIAASLGPDPLLAPHSQPKEKEKPQPKDKAPETPQPKDKAPETKPEPPASDYLKARPADPLKLDTESLRSAVILAPPGQRDPTRLIEMMRQAHPELGADDLKSGTATEQETLLSAENAVIKENTVTSVSLVVNLPEGSRLKATISGESLKTFPSQKMLTLNVRAGELRVTDEEGVARVVVRAAGKVEREGELHLEQAIENNQLVIRYKTDPVPAVSETNLILMITTENNEVVIRVLGKTTDSSQANVQATLDSKTGVPEGEKNPPAGAVRYQLLPADPAKDATVRYKIQWVHDMSKADPAKVTGQWPGRSAPAPIGDEEIRKLNKADALKEWTARKKAAAVSGLDAATKARLQEEADKCKARMQEASETGR